MYVLFAAAVVAAPPWIESADFPRAAQEKAFAVTVRLRQPNGVNTATAVRLLKDGNAVYYLTAAHNVQDLNKVTIEVFTLQSFPNPARIVNNVIITDRWPDADLALLCAIETETEPVAAVCPPDAIPTEPTFPVLTVGCTAGKQPELLSERVLRTVLARKGPTVTRSIRSWEVEKSPALGRSGGPMFDRNGYLIGICSGSGRENGEAKGYFTHSAEIRAALEKSVIATPLKAAEAAKKPSSEKK
jgi:S1-C subfamily serine protease